MIFVTVARYAMQSVFEKRPSNLLYANQVHGFEGFPPMFHSHGELLYVVSGSLNITIDGKDYVLQQGQLSILFPYLTHSYQNAPDAEVLFFLFDPLPLFISRKNKITTGHREKTPCLQLAS